MNYWWEIYPVKKPDLIASKDELFTTVQSLTGDLPIESTTYEAPAWTDIPWTKICINLNYLSVFPKCTIYHEIGHLFVNFKTYSRCLKIKKNFHIQAEYQANKYALKLAIKNKEYDLATDIINIALINDAAIHEEFKDNIVYTSHFYARQLFYKDKTVRKITKFLNLNIDEIMNYGDKWGEREIVWISNINE
jgi:hypothetical protein